MRRFTLFIAALCASSTLACDQNFTIVDGEEVVIESPDYPNMFPPRSECLYIISAPPGERITMDSREFSLRRNDWLWVFEGEADNHNNRTGTFENQVGPTGFISASNQIIVRLDSFGHDYGLAIFVLVLRKFVAFPQVYTCTQDATKRLAHNQFCDGVQDCPGGEDEFCLTNCGKQTFKPNWTDLKTMRIVNGSEAVPHSWPWQIGMEYKSQGQLFCGGTLIAPQWVMTAAHCCEGTDASRVHVLVGAHNRQKLEPSARRITVKTMYSHPGYVDSTTNNDFCLLHLAQQVDFTPETYPACLPRGNFVRPTGAQCYVSGWGTTRQGASSSPPGLRQTMMPLSDHSQCSRKYEGKITKEMMCGYNRMRDTCQGDSGGPLVCRVPGNETLFELTGITSWGQGCGHDGVPGVYANTLYSMDWILKTIASTNYQGWSDVYGYSAANLAGFAWSVLLVCFCLTFVS